MQDAIGTLAGIIVYVVFIGIAIAVPFYKICSRLGLSKGYLALLLVPVFGALILIWTISSARWPKVDRK